MSNQCVTMYAVTGRDEDVAALNNTLVEMQQAEHPIVDNDWQDPNMWLGCLVKALGGDPNELPCAGYIIDFSMPRAGTLIFAMQTNWCEYPELRHFIESRYPGMKIYYYEDCSENDILNTNDAEGRFFSQRIVIDSEDLMEEYNDGNFDDVFVAAKAVSEIVGYAVEPSGEAIEAALEEYMEQHPDVWYSYHEVQVLDD